MSPQYPVTIDLSMAFTDTFKVLWENTNRQLPKRLAYSNAPDSKVHVANMGPIWGRQDPGGLHVGPINFAIWGT